MTSTADHERLFEILDSLLDRWCEQRAFRPLKRILDAYPMRPVLTDEWARVYQMIRNLKGLGPDLPPDEMALVAEAHALIYQLLKLNPAGMGILETLGWRDAER